MSEDCSYHQPHNRGNRTFYGEMYQPRWQFLIFVYGGSVILDILETLIGCESIILSRGLYGIRSGHLLCSVNIIHPWHRHLCYCFCTRLQAVRWQFMFQLHSCMHWPYHWFYQDSSRELMKVQLAIGHRGRSHRFHEEHPRPSYVIALAAIMRHALRWYSVRSDVYDL